MDRISHTLHIDWDKRTITLISRVNQKVASCIINPELLEDGLNHLDALRERNETRLKEDT